MSMRSPAKSPRRSVNSTHTVLFVMDVLKLVTRVRERLARQRFVSLSQLYRSLLTSNVEGGRRGKQEEVNGSVVLFSLFLSAVCPCHVSMYSCTLKINPSTLMHAHVPES
jgi:hypothetical protein